MSTSLLLPNIFKKIGWFLLVPATAFGVLLAFNDFSMNLLNVKRFGVSDDQGSELFSFVDLTNTITGCLFIIGAMFVGFARQKHEDEFIANLRLNSLLWAVCVNYVLLLLAFIFIYGPDFLNVMLYNMFTVLIIFILRFNYLLYKHSRPAADEK